MKLTFDPESFRLGEKKFFPYSGEVHYFRIKKRYWRTHLKNLKAANLNTVSTYIPWTWHEYKEDKFDFTGKTCPERDIEGFIKLCKEYGLYMTVKPGPYILAEYINQGLPEWLSNNYPEIIAIRANKKKFPPYVYSYMHPTFLKLSLRWLDKILTLLKRYQTTQEGNIFMLQVCNEVGVNLWLSGEGDYSTTSINYYQKYLKETYNNIDDLNSLYKTKYKTFSQIKEAPSGPKTTKEDFIRYRDWHDFHRWYYALYLDVLIKKIKEKEIDIALYHNVPGWVYSRGTDFPLNITMYSEVFKKHPELFFAVDHIPETVGFTNFHDDFACNEILSSMQQRKKPLFVAELQAGSREHCIRTYPNEMELFYKACLAHDIKGMNFYMFSQGKNPERKGAFGPTFYWETVLDDKGKKTELYEPVKRIGAWIKNNSSFLLKSKRKADISIGFYRPYYQTEFIYPFPGKKSLINFKKVGLNYDPKRMMTDHFFDGVIKILKMLNASADINDLESTNLKTLKRYKQLWVVSLEYMDKATQLKLSQYVSGGGCLIILPTLPNKDLNLKPCSLLKKQLKIKQLKAIEIHESKIDFYNQEDIQCYNRINIFKPDHKKEIVASINKLCCGLEKKIGQGKVIVLGTSLSYKIAEHLASYQKLLSRSKIINKITVDNDYLTLVPRYINEDSLLLFVLNYHRVSHEGTIKLTIKNKKITLPKFCLGATKGLILPINIGIPKTDYTISYATCEVIAQAGNNKNISLKLFGYQGPEASIAIKIKNKPKKVCLGKINIPFKYKTGEVIVKIKQTGKIENLKIYF
ncbi:beta-galactosidase [Candidatus Auribacterota bacterium]